MLHFGKVLVIDYFKHGFTAAYRILLFMATMGVSTATGFIVSFYFPVTFFYFEMSA
jgi:hypothetical protein